jgi:hypothetical protein
LQSAAGAWRVCRPGGGHDGPTEWETDADQRIPPLARSKYSLPILDNHPALVEDGVPGLLTQKGFETAYTGYQQHMIDELNASTAGTMTAVRRCTRRSKD